MRWWNKVKCSGQPSALFLTNKRSQNSENIAISENGKIISDTSEISEQFNTFVVNVAKDIGDSASCGFPEDHPSIRAIHANNSSIESEFKFKPVDEAKISRYFGRICLRKATGPCIISSKILHLSDKFIVGPTTSLINRMITEKKFPDPLKYARISPIFEKKETPLISKIGDQLVSYPLLQNYLNVH